MPEKQRLRQDANYLQEKPNEPLLSTQSLWRMCSPHRGVRTAPQESHDEAGGVCRGICIWELAAMGTPSWNRQTCFPSTLHSPANTFKLIKADISGQPLHLCLVFFPDHFTPLTGRRGGVAWALFPFPWGPGIYSMIENSRLITVFWRVAPQFPLLPPWGLLRVCATSVFAPGWFLVAHFKLFDFP